MNRFPLLKLYPIRKKKIQIYFFHNLVEFTLLAAGHFKGLMGMKTQHSIGFHFPQLSCQHSLK